MGRHRGIRAVGAILFCPYCGERIPIEWDEYESEWSTSEYIDAATGESHHGVAGGYDD